MLFYLSKFAWFVLQPSSFLLISLCLGIWLLLRRQSRWGRRLTLFALAGLLIGGFSPLGHWLTLPLEQRFAPPQLATLGAVEGIVVLGGALDTIVTRARGVPALNEAGERMTEAVWLSRELPQARLIFTGGTAVYISANMSESEAAAQLFSRMGVDGARAEFETRSRTTYENAVRLREQLMRRPDQGGAIAALPGYAETGISDRVGHADKVPGRWLLVTSAWHMPRAVGSFRKLGFDVISWPVDYRTRGMDDLWRGFDRPSEGLQRLDIVSKEWAGLVAYWLLGRSSGLLPGP